MKVKPVSLKGLLQNKVNEKLLNKLQQSGNVYLSNAVTIFTYLLQRYIQMIDEDIKLSEFLFSEAQKHPELEALTQHLSIATIRYIPLHDRHPYF